jgi:hypothetical protein
MGVDIHDLNFFRFAAGASDLGKVATLGRQNLTVPRERLRKLLNLEKDVDFGPFCEELLKSRFGATQVDSYDISGFEGATHIADMNHPLTTECTYDMIIDCGTLEHIYNVPQALANISLLCGHGGRILHVVPANNWCGHGFWQFSPELFYSVYSENNGYQDTRIFLAKVADTLHWYEVQPPANGRRVDITSCTKLMMLVITKKRSVVGHRSVQQSDYVHHWSNETPEDTTPSRFSIIRMRIRDALAQTPLLPVARVIYDGLAAKTTVSGRNHHLRKHRVADLIAQSNG